MACVRLASLSISASLQRAHGAEILGSGTETWYDSLFTVSGEHS